MTEMSSRRRDNLRRLVSSQGGSATFLKNIGYTKGWLSQLIGKTQDREISEKVARETEHKVGISQGALDIEVITNSKLAADCEVNIAKTLNENLRNLMTHRGVNQAELARRSNMAVAAVNRVFNALENDVSPSLETLAGIARGLGVHASELLRPNSDAPPSAPHEPAFAIARQLSRLIEDFVLSGPNERLEILSLSAQSATKPAEPG